MYFRRRAACRVLAVAMAAQIAFPVPPAEGSRGQAQTSETSSPALLRMKVVEGDGAVHTAGSRSTQPLILFLSDEAGRPVEHASVSFRLPDDGPSGQFPGGLRTEVLLTGPDGRAAIRSIQWNRIAGPVQIRVTASKGEARAGLISTQYVTEPASSVARRGAEPASSGPQPRVESASRGKWVVVAALVGAAAAGGMAAAVSGGRGATPSGPAPPALTQPAAPSLGIGNPTITVGRP